MPISQDFVAYQKSLASELLAAKDRVRNLIGDAHWLSDGEHKEAVLRKLLRNHLAQSLQIGRGFVCGNGETSSQIDVLVTQRDKPTLFRDGDLLLVTPDAVSAVIEVKTSVDASIENVLVKLADTAEMVRSIGNQLCVAGLFVFDGDKRHEPDNRILRAVQSASRGQSSRIVNWVAVGPDLFVRYWREGSDVNSPIQSGVWHSYTLHGLAHSYFISNAAWDTCGDQNRGVQYAWFPIGGTKELHRTQYIAIDGTEPQRFAS